MPNDADLIEQAEDEVWQIIERMHKAGVRYEVLDWMFENIWRSLIMKNQAENYLDGGEG